MGHFEDACNRMIVSHCAATMNMLETKTVQDKFNELQAIFKKSNAAKRQATQAAQHQQKLA